jgi:hypothetical protein
MKGTKKDFELWKTSEIQNLLKISYQFIVKFCMDIYIEDFLKCHFELPIIKVFKITR